MNVQSAGVLVDRDVGARAIGIRELDEPARHHVEKIGAEVRDLDAVALEELRCGVVHRSGHLHDEVVLARVAVLLLCALSREARRGALAMQAPDVAIVDHGCRVTAERVLRAIEAAG